MQFPKVVVSCIKIRSTLGFASAHHVFLNPTIIHIRIGYYNLWNNLKLKDYLKLGYYFGLVQLGFLLGGDTFFRFAVSGVAASRGFPLHCNQSYQSTKLNIQFLRSNIDMSASELFIEMDYYQLVYLRVVVRSRKIETI